MTSLSRIGGERGGSIVPVAFSVLITRAFARASAGAQASRRNSIDARSRVPEAQATFEHV